MVIKGAVYSCFKGLTALFSFCFVMLISYIVTLSSATTGIFCTTGNRLFRSSSGLIAVNLQGSSHKRMNR